jgi:hypothetical protein
MSKNTSCEVCTNPISWKSARRRFCSTTCKNKFYQKNSYLNQQKRGRDRKIKLVLRKGGKCEKCGYDKNYAALCFHHLDPNTKEVALDLRRLSNSKMSILEKESEKCQLLCSNCHAEAHNPECIF